MAVYNGITGKDTLVGPPKVNLSASVVFNPPFIASFGYVGEHIHSPSFLYPSQTRSGVVVVDNPLWDKIILHPVQIEAGLIVQNTDFQGFIWNTKKNQIIFNSYDLENIDGIVVNPAPPVPVSPCRDITITITVLVEGSPIIDGFIVFDLSGEFRKIYIQGLRGLIFSFSPSFPYTEGEKFRTNILKSYTGKEHRKAILEKSKYEWKYRIQVNNEEMQKLQRLIHYALRTTILHPVWSSFSRLTSDTDGTRIIYCDTAYRDFQPGEYLLLKNSEYEDAVKIESVQSGQITLQKPPRYQFYKGDIVVPLKPATLKKTQRLKYPHSQYGVYDIEVEEV